VRTAGLVAAAIAALALALPAAPGGTAPIVLGGTAPLSDVDSAGAAVSRGAAAYFRYVNARGGLNGRRIAYRTADDAGDPTQTPEATRRLVEDERAFAIVAPFGTEQSLAVRAYLNAAKVPQLFVASGSAAFASDPSRYAWTIGYRPSYRAEGAVYGRFLARTRPGSTVAVLAEADVAGRELLAGLRDGLARSRVTIAAVETAEPGALDPQVQVARLRTSRAGVLALFANGAAALRAASAARRSGWRPSIVVAAEGARERIDGAVSATFLKEPGDPRWAADPGLRLYRTVLARYAPGARSADAAHLYGMALAYTTVETLRAAGPNASRATVLAAARSLRSSSNPFLVPGITVETRGADGAPVEQLLLQRRVKGAWRSFGGLWRVGSG
jgi:branched-chain amino acid transport system substrate-binding protein